MESPELWQLLSSADKRERDKGLKLLMQEMYGLIVSYLMGLGATREDAEEVFFDGLLVVDTNAQKEQFSIKDNIQGYLKHTSRNIWLKKQRKNKLKFTTIDDFIDFLKTDGVVIPSLMDDQLRRKIDFVLRQLKPKCQTIFRLAFFEGLSPLEILNHLELKSPDVLKTSKNRCMKKLREIIDAHGGKGFFNE